MSKLRDNAIGISSIAVFEPKLHVGNEWFGNITRKFVHHTGIESRMVSSCSEISMAVRVVEKLRRETACDLRDCAGIVFVSPSYIPLAAARKHLSPNAVRRESLRRAARIVARRLGLNDTQAVGMNWFCSGYAKALEVVQQKLIKRSPLQQNQFVLVINANRISRITDYGCAQTAPLFGDMATATLIARTDSVKYPTHFSLAFARAEKQPANGVFFDFQLKPVQSSPLTRGNGPDIATRLVFSLDGMGIADAAPRAMSSAVADALMKTKVLASDVSFVLPHQAGSGIVRFTTMKLEEQGIRGEVINGITSKVGNVSSCSIPYGLKSTWQKLQGTIVCPTAAVGDPGKAEVSRGCIVLHSTSTHSSGLRIAG